MNAFLLVPSLLCAGIAAYLAYKDKEGWGWFLFAAIILFPQSFYLNLK